MSAKLIILGLLQEGPMYGYEIKRRIEHEAMAEWAGFSYGAIYSALNKLARDGFVEKISTEQVGKRPSRDVYQITESGREEFLRLLRQVWREMERHYYTLDIGLAFMEALPVEEVEGYLRDRVSQLEGIIQHVTAHRAEVLADAYVTRVVSAVFDHSLAHFEAELAWTRDVLDKVERGAYL
jgi:DNA-binding PadR family transcriptional regulator